MAKQVPFHVYSMSGFEGAHSTAAAAIKAAKRAAKNHGALCTVVRCSLSGYTGGGHGTEIWASNGRPVAG